MASAAKSHLQTAWELFKRYWAVFLLAELAALVAWVALEIAVVTARRSGIPAVAYWPLWLCLHLAFFWIFCGLMVGIHRMALLAVDGGAPTFATVLSHLDRGTIYLFTSLLYWAAVIGGLGLAVIPGVVAAVKWAPFRFVLAESPQSAVSTLHEAASLSASHRLQVFRSLAVSLVLNLAGVALLGVGLFVSFPITVILRASDFRTLHPFRFQQSQDQ